MTLATDYDEARRRLGLTETEAEERLDRIRKTDPAIVESNLQAAQGGGTFGGLNRFARELALAPYLPEPDGE